MARHEIASLFARISAGVIRFVAFIILFGTAFSVCGSQFSEEYLTDVWTADDGLPDSSVTAIAQTPDGYLWVGTYNGLVRFDGVRFVTFDPANTPALAHARVRKLSVDDQGTLWINTFDGSMTALRHGIFSREWNREETLDPDAMLLLSESNQITFLLHHGSLRRKALPAPAGSSWEDLYPTNRSVGGLCIADGTGTIWYRGSDKHLSRVTTNGFAALPLSAGLGDSQVNCITTDPQGRLWVGTDREIAMWNGTRFQIVTPTNAEPAGDVSFLSVAEDSRLWASMGGRVREALGREWIAEAPSLKNVFTGNLSRSGTHADHHGGVWLYDYALGLWHVAVDGSVRQFGSQEGFPGERVNCLFEDHEGNWWAGLDAGGLVRIRERRFQIIDTGGQLPAKPARSVCEETNGAVWIGTLGDGLARWQGDALTNFTMPGGTGKGFVFCVCPDSAGRLWASAGDEDLYVRRQDETFTARGNPLYTGSKLFLQIKKIGSGSAPRAVCFWRLTCRPLISGNRKESAGAMCAHCPKTVSATCGRERKTADYFALPRIPSKHFIRRTPKHRRPSGRCSPSQMGRFGRELSAADCCV